MSDTWLDESQPRDDCRRAGNSRINRSNRRKNCVVMRFHLTGKIPVGARIAAATPSL